MRRRRREELHKQTHPSLEPDSRSTSRNRKTVKPVGGTDIESEKKECQLKEEWGANSTSLRCPQVHILPPYLWSPNAFLPNSIFPTLSRSSLHIPSRPLLPTFITSPSVDNHTLSRLHSLSLTSSVSNCLLQ